MNSYVQNENQNLLWNAVQKIPQFQLMSNNDKNSLFRDAVKVIYTNKTKNRRISSNDLKELNKETIQYIIQQCKNASPQIYQNNINYSFSENRELDTMRPIQPISDIKGSRQEQYVSEVANRQREYENMMKKDVPPEPNFKEKIEDTAIENMEELLQRQLKQRELDIQNITNNSILPPPTPRQKVPKKVQIVEKLDLSEYSEDNLEVPTIDIPSASKPQNEADFDVLNQKIDHLKHNLDMIFDILHGMIHGIKSDFQKIHNMIESQNEIPTTILMPAVESNVDPNITIVSTPSSLEPIAEISDTDAIE